MPEDPDPFDPSTTSQVLGHQRPTGAAWDQGHCAAPPLTLMTALPGVYYLHFQQRIPSLKGCLRSRGHRQRAQLQGLTLLQAGHLLDEDAPESLTFHRPDYQVPGTAYEPSAVAWLPPVTISPALARPSRRAPSSSSDTPSRPSLTLPSQPEHPHTPRHPHRLSFSLGSGLNSKTTLRRAHPEGCLKPSLAPLAAP